MSDESQQNQRKKQQLTNPMLAPISAEESAEFKRLSLIRARSIALHNTTP